MAYSVQTAGARKNQITIQNLTSHPIQLIRLHHDNIVDESMEGPLSKIGVYPQGEPWIEFDFGNKEGRTDKKGHTLSIMRVNEDIMFFGLFQDQSPNFSVGFLRQAQILELEEKTEQERFIRGTISTNKLVHLFRPDAPKEVVGQTLKIIAEISYEAGMNKFNVKIMPM